MVHLDHDNIANRIPIDQLLVLSKLYIQLTKILQLSDRDINRKKISLLISLLIFQYDRNSNDKKGKIMEKPLFINNIFEK